MLSVMLANVSARSVCDRRFAEQTDSEKTEANADTQKSNSISSFILVAQYECDIVYQYIESAVMVLIEFDEFSLRVAVWIIYDHFHLLYYVICALANDAQS